MAPKLPLLYTHVMGSHGFPGWFWTALDKIKAEEYGQTDVRETFDDATQLAIRDQERAGIDVICDGEMRRFFFVQSFYGKMEGLEVLEPLRKTGLYAYDSVPRYRPTRKITVPKGLGTVDEFKYLKTQTDKPVKATCPGPVTLSIHVQTRPGDAYNNDRLALCWDLVPAVNAELKALATAGADWIQVDEPSAAIVPGQAPEYVKMFNACVEGVKAKIGYHVCFGNLLSRPRGKRSYRWMFPALLETKCQQFVFEYANREMAEIEMWKEVGVDRDVACGVVDVKSFYMETPEDIAERVRLCLRYIPAERLSLIPDCGFFPVPRWVAFEKLKGLAGTWTANMMTPDGPTATMEYRVTGGGSVVMETMMAGTPDEMINMYTVDGDSVLAQHYCSAGNQPLLRLNAGKSNATQLVFDFVKVTGPGETYINGVTIRFTEDGKAQEMWTSKGEDGVKTFYLQSRK